METVLLLQILLPSKVLHMPTILRIGNMRFFFNSREESRRHVHISTPDGVAKFWLEPIVSLASFHGLHEKYLNRIEDIVKEKRDEFIHEWNGHFGI